MLHAPTYRARYAEFLRIDFPRVPFPELADDFETLSGLGWALSKRTCCASCRGAGWRPITAGATTMSRRCATPAEQAIAINKTQSFKPVPQAVWDFHIGGYQVLDKYLKSRKGRVLSLDEIDHVGAVADSLAFTIEQMARIDEAYKAAFPDPADRAAPRTPAARLMHNGMRRFLGNAENAWLATGNPTFSRRRSSPTCSAIRARRPIAPILTRCARGCTKFWPRRGRRSGCHGNQPASPYTSRFPADDALSTRGRGRPIALEFESELERLKAA